jgi:hypothetical protein
MSTALRMPRTRLRLRDEATKESGDIRRAVPRVEPAISEKPYIFTCRFDFEMGWGAGLRCVEEAAQRNRETEGLFEGCGHRQDRVVRSRTRHVVIADRRSLVIDGLPGED